MTPETTKILTDLYKRRGEKEMSGDSYATPKWLMDVFSGWFDPCPLNDNPEIDGLFIEWGVRTYVNPPYSEPHKWVEKAIQEKKKGKLIVMLLRADSSTKYFQRCQEEGEVIYFGRRIKFNGKTPYFASMLVIFNGLGTGRPTALIPIKWVECMDCCGIGKIDYTESYQVNRICESVCIDCKGTGKVPKYQKGEVFQMVFVDITHYASGRNEEKHRPVKFKILAIEGDKWRVGIDDS